MTIERVKPRAPPSWLARLWAAVVRLLVKMVFFSGMTALGMVGAYWLPDFPSFPINDSTPHTLVLSFVTIAASLCAVCMLWGGLIGLWLTVFTAGRKPSWD